MSLGLGKTVQVIAFLQAIFSCPEIALRTCLVLCPASTVLNWKIECDKWRKGPDERSSVPKELWFKVRVHLCILFQFFSTLFSIFFLFPYLTIHVFLLLLFSWTAQSYVVKTHTNRGPAAIRDNIDILKTWKKQGGALIMSYSLYLSYVKEATKDPSKQKSGRKLSTAEKKEMLNCLRDSGWYSSSFFEAQVLIVKLTVYVFRS